MGKYIRLVDYKSPSEKEKHFFDASNTFFFSKDKYYDIPGKAFSYQISDRLYNIFVDAPKMETISEPKVGLQTGKNDLYYREWTEVAFDKISFNGDMSSKWFPCIKGGEKRKWYGNFGTIIDWQNDGARIRRESGSVVRNPDFYLKKGLTWTKITSNFALRMYPDGMIMTDASVFVFPDDELAVLGCLNSCVMPAIVGALNPTLNFVATTVASLPILFPDNLEEVRRLVSENIEISRREWDSTEYSWEFKKHCLIPENSENLISEIFDKRKHERETDKDVLRNNEERLNVIFAEVYGMVDEVDVKVDEVTIADLSVKDAVRSLISYAVGCVMGRYSLKIDGLVYAGGQFDDSKYRTDFMPCEYGVLPITEEQFFEEDLCTRVLDFIRVVYGENSFNENLKFIASALCPGSYDAPKKILREYLFNDFYNDHYQVYQHRPIYWQLDSGKAGGFRAILYMHRFDENTLPLVRTEFIQDLRYKYEEEMQRQKGRLEGASTTAERNAIKKDINGLDKKIVECSAYDELLNHASSSIQNYVFDLDDGVKINYAKFLSIDGDKTKNILTVIKL